MNQEGLETEMVAEGDVGGDGRGIHALLAITAPNQKSPLTD